jgi:YVTN family beta-propeller protein
MKSIPLGSLCPSFVFVVALALGISPATSAPAPDSATVQIFPITPGVFPGEIAFDGANIWVTDFFFSTLIKVRASDGVILGRYSGVYEPLRIASNGTSVWAATELGDLYKVRTSDGVVEQVIDLGSSPSGQVLFDGTNIWVASWGVGNGLTKIRPSDGAILGVSTVGKSPFGLAFDGENIWVTNNADDTVSKVRASDGQVLFTVPAGPSPWGIVYDGEGIWVANSNARTLTHLQASDGAILGVTRAGDEPRLLTFDGRSVWAGNWSPDNVVQRFRPRDPGQQQLFREGTNPEGMLFDGTSIWISYEGSGTLCKITPAP